ncbi:hypothetical protein [Roseateles sp.]|mgnify:CR=1 FL=1|uniref:hypothetical protein n=1 Tax=Roseateles sp. TaxID=1971397 RepID=UPI0039584C6F
MSIAEPSPEQITECFKIEQSLGFDAPDADTAGFFLPGATEALYQDLYKTGYTRVILDDAGRVSSYVVVVPPGHSIVERSLANNPAMLLCGDTPSPDPKHSIWIAKVASQPAARRSGQARALYAQVFADFAGCTAFTTTALSPKRNPASEGFHAAMGMQRAGVFLSPPRGEVKHIVNLLWRKQL